MLVFFSFFYMKFTTLLGPCPLNELALQGCFKICISKIAPSDTNSITVIRKKVKQNHFSINSDIKPKVMAVLLHVSVVELLRSVLLKPLCSLSQRRVYTMLNAAGCI